MDMTDPFVDVLALVDPQRARGRATASMLRKGSSITSDASAPRNSGDWYRRGLDEMERDPDYSSAVEHMKQQGDSASRAMVLALAAREAGPGFEGLSRHFLNRTNVEPIKMQGATIDAQGNVVRDPNFQRERQAEILMRRGDMAAREEGARTEADRRAAERAEDRAQREALARLAAGSRTSNEPLVSVVDPDTGQPVLVRRSQAAGMQPFRAGDAKTAVDAGKARSDAAEVVALLDEAKRILPGATGSGAGALVDKGAAFFGKATDGAKAGARLKAIGGLLTSKMPRMQGPQSDKDVQLYREMAGAVGDDTLPIETRLNALGTVREINARYAGADVAPGMGTPAFSAGAAKPAGAVRKFNPATGRLE